MVLISLRDYAEQKNISYEAVRKQVTRYKSELDGHIIMDGRQQFLDEDAVAFLDSKRQKNPVAIIQQSKNETIEMLEEQVKQLLIKTAAQADKISELSEWKAENSLLIASADQTRLALEAAQEEKKILEVFIQDAKNEITALTEEKSLELAETRQRAEEAEARVKETQEALEASEAKLEALKNEKEFVLQENELLKARKWYQMIFKKT